MLKHGKGWRLTSLAFLSLASFGDVVQAAGTSLFVSPYVAAPTPHQSQGPGVLPVTVAAVDYAGPLSTNTSHPRDIGFSGVVNGQILWTFADTMVTSDPGSMICASNTAALGDYFLPLNVTDKSPRSDGCPQEFIPFVGSELPAGLSAWADWITNPVEYAPNQAVVFYTEQYRGVCVDCDYRGSGAARVSADGNGPYSFRPQEITFNGFEPLWGSTGAAFDPADGYIYLYGHGPTTLDQSTRRNVYMARVKAAGVMDVSQYQYFDNSTGQWGTTRFTDDGRFGTVKVSDKQALFVKGAVGQSYPFWSNYYNTWMWVHGDDWGNGTIYIMTAPSLQGPWTSQPGVTIDTCVPVLDCPQPSLQYGMAGHPEFDPSGKTLLVTWTSLSNRIYMKKITFR